MNYFFYGVWFKHNKKLTLNWTFVFVISLYCNHSINATSFFLLLYIDGYLLFFNALFHVHIYKMQSYWILLQNVPGNLRTKKTNGKIRNFWYWMVKKRQTENYIIGIEYSIGKFNDSYFLCWDIKKFTFMYAMYSQNIIQTTNDISLYFFMLLYQTTSRSHNKRKNPRI